MTGYQRNPLPFALFRGFVTSSSLSGARAGLLALALFATAGAHSLSAAEARVDLANGWNGNTGREFPGAVGEVASSPDGKALSIAYDFTNGGQYISAARTLEKIESVATIKLKAVGPGHMSVGVKDSSGQDFLYHLGMTASDEQLYTLDLSKPNKAWGGAGDKVIHYPLRSMRILANKKPESLKGTLVIKEILLVRAP